MSTLTELKTRIANDLHRSDCSVQIGEAINAAIKHYGRERWWFLETTYTFTTSATNTYSIPSDFVQPDTFLATVSSSKYPLDYVDYKTMDEEDSGLVTGTPSSIAMYGGNFRVYPTPNGSYPITISYHKTLDAPSDAASNSWTTDAEELIRFRAEWDVYHNYIRNPEMAQMAKQSESEAFGNLLSMNVKRLSTGRIKKSGF